MHVIEMGVAPVIRKMASNTEAVSRAPSFCLVALGKLRMYVPACTICNLMTADITKKQKAQQNVLPHYTVQEENQFLVLSCYF